MENPNPTAIQMHVPTLSLKLSILEFDQKVFWMEAPSFELFLESLDPNKPRPELTARNWHTARTVSKKVLPVLEEVYASVYGSTNTETLRLECTHLVKRYTNVALAMRELHEAKVTCDDTNNPPDLVDRSGFALWLGIKPTPTLHNLFYELLIE